MSVSLVKRPQLYTTFRNQYESMERRMPRVELRGAGIRESVRECARTPEHGFNHKYCVSMRDINPYIRQPLTSYPR